MEEPLPERGAILKAAIGIGLYAMAFGASFGAISVGSGLTVAQTMVLSLVMFTGASQFAFVGVATAGGSPLAAVPASLLLGVRNAFYGVPLSEILHPRGVARLWTAHFVIDETTAMAVSQATPRARRYAFWATGLIYALSMVYWIWVLARVPLSIAYPIATLSLAIVPLLSWFVFSEPLSFKYWIGIFLMLGGIQLIVR